MRTTRLANIIVTGVAAISTGFLAVAALFVLVDLLAWLTAVLHVRWWG